MRVAVIVDRRLQPGRWHVYDAAGRSLHTGQPAELHIRQVVAAWPAEYTTCDGNHPPFDGQVVDSADGSTCYGLAWPEIRVSRTVSSEAVSDPQNNRWLVEVELRPADARRFAHLTERVWRLPEPRNQVAFVFDGKVLSAPTIQEPIRGGRIQLSGGLIDEQRARDLAADLDSR
jgi:preprotein translocase subunit SecD